MTPNEIAAYRDQTERHAHSYVGVQTIRALCSRCKTHKPVTGSRIINGRRLCADCAPKRDILSGIEAATASEYSA